MKEKRRPGVEIFGKIKESEQVKNKIYMRILKKTDDIEIKQYKMGKLEYGSQ